MMNPQVGLPNDILGRDTCHLTLVNDFRVNLVNDPNRARVGVSLTVITPMRYERPEYTGLAHLVALALVDGSGNYPMRDEFMDFFSDSGFNITPSIHSMRFKFAIDSVDLDEGLNRLSDAISLPELPSDSVELVRNRIERRYHFLTESYSYQVLRREEQLYGVPTPSYFKLLDEPDISSRFHELLARFYKPSNMLLTVVYDDSISRDEVIEIVTRNFHDIADQRANVLGDEDYVDSCLVGDPTENTLSDSSSAEKDDVDASASELSAAGDVVTISRLYAATTDQILWITFPTPNATFSSEHYWNYLLSTVAEGSLGYVLQSLQLATSIESTSYVWNVAGEHSRRTTVLYLTSKGVKSVEFILSLFFEYVSLVRNKEVTEDVYVSSLQYYLAQKLHDLSGDDDDVVQWCEVLDRYLDSEYEYRDTSYDPHSIAEEARHFNKDRCNVILVSRSFHALGTKTSSEFSLIEDDVPVALPTVPSESGLYFPDRPFALPTSLDMSMQSGITRDTGFTELNQYPLVTQRWTSGRGLIMRLKLPLTQIANSAAGYVQASALTLRLGSSASKGLFSGSARYAGGALDITIKCLPDALLNVVKALFALVKANSSLTSDQLAEIKDSLKAEFKSNLAKQRKPAFDSHFEQLIRLRSFESELADLKDVTVDMLPPIEAGYFAMLLVGNVQRAHTQEVAQLVGSLSGSRMTNGPYRQVITESLPNNIFTSTTPVVRSLLPYPHEGSAFLYAFHLGDYTTEMMAKAVAFASIAATVVRQDLRVGHLIAPSVVSKAVHARGHVWFVIEIVGHKNYNHVAPLVHESLFESMADAFQDLDEDDMVAARGRAHAELFEPRDTMEAEAERLWQPMYWAGEPYVLETIEALEDTDSSELSRWYRDHVKSEETRKMVHIAYKRERFPDPPAEDLGAMQL